MKTIVLLGLSILTLCSGATGGLKQRLVSKAIEKLPEKIGVEVELTADEISTLTQIVQNHSDKTNINDIKVFVKDEDYEGLIDYGLEVLSESEEESLKSIYDNHKN